ncbi:MAG: peptidylprolyl isomerase [Myxococcales bacterium]|jgi:peptidyl-prolyl cis-trans isomerase D|nr:peptidylprolyl isomerase [Myxococcales bacterium]
MLDLFRKSGLKSVIYGAIIVATVLAFVISWPSSRGSKGPSLKESCVVTVRSVCVDPKTHRAAYRILIPRDGGGNLLTAKAKAMGLSRISLDGLIERELLAAEAERLGLTVTEEEINDSIYGGFIRVSVPAADPGTAFSLRVPDGYVYAGFKDPKSKQFDMKVYERSIRSLTGRSPVEFRDWQAREILAAKMRDLVRAPVRVSDTEAFELYVGEKSTAQLQYVTIKQSWVERWMVSSTQAQIDEWAKDQSNASQVKAPNIRHILIRPEGDKPEAKAAAKEKAEKLIERVKKGEDFAKLAKEHSQDPGSGKNGGELGDKTDGFVEPFKKAADALKANEMTQAPVETQFGWHIIKKDDPARSAYLKAKGVAAAKELATKIQAAMKGGASADDAIKAAIAPYVKAPPAAPAGEAPKPAAGPSDAGAPDAAKPEAPKVETADTDPDRPTSAQTSAFNRGGDPISSLGLSETQKVMEFAFAGKDGEMMPEPLRSHDGFVLLSIKARKAATREEYDKERDTFTAAIVAAKQAEALSLYVKRLRETHKEEIKIDETQLIDAPTKGDGGAPTPAEDDEE